MLSRLVGFALTFLRIAMTEHSQPPQLPHPGPIRYGALELPSRYMLSPLAGFTNLAFRRVCREQGGLGLATTDLVSARGLVEGSPKSLQLIESCSEDRECTRGFCADGVCCNARCSGQCEACDLDGAVGVCQQNEGPPRSGRPACEGAGGPCEGVCGSDPDECDYVPIACSAGSCAEGQLTIGRCHLEGRGVCATTTEAC